jgi:hypothetical protein
MKSCQFEANRKSSFTEHLPEPKDCCFAFLPNYLTNGSAMPDTVS